jgi:hypothetical protein
MFITGNPFSDVLTYLTLILPLLSVAIILFRKEYSHDEISFVMILCVFLFIQMALFSNIQKFGLDPQSTFNVFNAIEFMLMVMILKMHTSSVRYVLNGFVIAYVSSIITYYAILGFTDDQLLLRCIQHGLMITLMGVTIARQWHKQSLEMMNTPIFWISISTMFYFCFCLFWETGKTYIFNEAETISIASIMFMKVATVIRFLVFSFAVWFLEPSEETRPYAISRNGMRVEKNDGFYDPNERHFGIGESFSITG